LQNFTMLDAEDEDFVHYSLHDWFSFGDAIEDDDLLIERP